MEISITHNFGVIQALFIKRKMMIDYQAVRVRNSHASIGGCGSYSGSGLAGCAGDVDVQLRCYLFIYISILKDFSHADKLVG